jgi:hypothetical protein
MPEKEDMKILCYRGAAHKGVALLAALLLLGAGAGAVQAQWVTKWLAVGDLHYPYLSGGAEPENLVAQSNYPGIQPDVEYNHWKGLWISAKNVTDETGRVWDLRTSHIGPRGLGLGEVFDIEHNLVARFEPPVALVDGFETFQRPTFVDAVDPSIAPDRMVASVINTSIGVQVERTAMQWSQELHDNYHIIEYTFTNTGNVDDDEQVEVEGQTLEDVYFVFLDRPKINAASGSWDNSSGGMAWGQHVMNDAVWPGIEDYDSEFRAQFTWIGREQAKAEVFNTIGNPMWANHQWNSVADDTLGRLGGANLWGLVTLHADQEAHAPGAPSPDDPAQPSTMTYLDSDWSDITTGNDHTNEASMAFERRWIENGSGPAANAGNIDDPADPTVQGPRTVPQHADQVWPRQGSQTWIEQFASQRNDPSFGKAGGWGVMNAYGPYNMAPGEQVKIVMAEVVAGLSEEAAFKIGRAYRRSGANDDMQVTLDVNGEPVSMTKNEWALTARDTLFQAFQWALNNYRSGGADVARAPLPPSRFEVSSGTDQIQATWEALEGDPHHWELYRAEKAYHGVITALRLENGIAVPDSSRAYQCIAGCPGTPDLPGSARSFTDNSVQRGLSYFYYLQAADGEPTLDAASGRSIVLKSSRYYAQTFEPAFLRRAPGATLDAVRMVPNPYNLAADTDVRFGDQQDKVAFFGLPGDATIKIYTELGELVTTIEHTDGSGDEFWDLTTSSRQVVVSGIYLVVIVDNETGDQATQKLIIIR